MRERLRRFLHHYDRHILCREVYVVDEYDYSKEYIKARDGELIDVTPLGGKVKRYHWEHR